MIKITNKKKCSGCEACSNICPKQCISMKEDIEGFLYPEVNTDKCIECHLCEKVCPIKNEVNYNTEDEIYACYAKKYSEQLTSSSGGFFSVLARYILSMNGIVYGASFDDDFNVKHSYINDVNELELLKGTKYVQSRMGYIFKDVKKNLDEDRLVLFSGTSCQVAGLKFFLRQDYKNLYTVDLICHGVPSPKIWREYLNEISKGRSIEYINFRNKMNGSSELCFEIKYSDGQMMQEKYLKNNYINGFIKNMYLRPSCFECHFKESNRYSDFTIGDFWGVDEFHRKFSNGHGTSVVVVHNKKGREIFQSIKTDINYVKSDLDSMVMWNICYKESVKEDKLKKLFYDKYEEIGINNTIESLTKINEKKSLLQLIRNRVKRLHNKY